MITQEMRQKFGTIKPYDGDVFQGKLDLSNPKVLEMSKEVLDLYLNGNPSYFISTFLYFYHIAPQQENPVTINAFEDTINIHPGQGRLVASYFRGDKTIDAIFVPVNKTAEEIETLKSVTQNFTPATETIYSYNNQNHHGLSTKSFEMYFYPTDIRLAHEKEKDTLLFSKINHHLPVLWKFKSRENIKLGEGKAKTIVKCKNSRGFFESVAYLALGHFKDSKNYGIINK